MWKPAAGLLAALAAPGCDAAPYPAACDGDRPVQLVQTENFYFEAAAVGDFTYLSGITFYNDLEPATLHVARGCGVDAVKVVEGLPMGAARIHLDPADDDPTIACGTHDGRFYRIDPDGAAPPSPLLPYLDCRHAQPTTHGPLLPGEGRLWLVPDFPDDTTAQMIADEVHPQEPRFSLRGDAVLVRQRDYGLYRHDLVTGARVRLAEDVYFFTATATHLLWIGRVDGAVAPAYLRELAGGEDLYLGQSDSAEDWSFYSGGRWDPAWQFDGAGRSVLHLPRDPAAPMRAWDLAGRPLAFPESGWPLASLADGSVVMRDAADRPSLVRAGEPAAIALDFIADEQSAPEVVDGRLEVLQGGDLHAVPLDGGPRELLARDIGSDRVWLDAETLLTVAGRELVATYAPANARTRLGSDVQEFQWLPGRGVYFSRWITDTHPGNGIWLAPDAALRPTPNTCPGTYMCK